MYLALDMHLNVLKTIHFWKLMSHFIRTISLGFSIKVSSGVSCIESDNQRHLLWKKSSFITATNSYMYMFLNNWEVWPHHNIVTAFIFDFNTHLYLSISSFVIQFPKGRKRTKKHNETNLSWHISEVTKICEIWRIFGDVYDKILINSKALQAKYEEASSPKGLASDSLVMKNRVITQNVSWHKRNNWSHRIRRSSKT